MKKMVLENHVAVVMSLHELDLAQKISDKILCVKGDTIFGYGEPEAIFKEDFIQTMEYCRQIELEFCLNRNIGLRIMQNIFRAFAPLM